VIVVVLNMLIAAAIRGLVAFSRYDSLTDAHRASVVRLAVAQFVNMALVVLIVNSATGPSPLSAAGADNSTYVATNVGCFADSGPYRCFAGPDGIFLRGNHFDLGPRWYVDVGAQLVFTLIVTLLTRNVGHLASTGVHAASKWWSAGGVRHVEKMKALYTGPKPLIPELLGKLYAYVLIVVIFSTALPILYPLLALYLALAYVFDKWYLLRICRKPIPYGSAFVHATLWMVEYALVFKMLFFVWAFGSLPGTLISEAVANYYGYNFDSFSGQNNSALNRSTAKQLWASSEGVQQVTIVKALSSSSWLSERVVTVGSAVAVSGLGLLLLLLLVCCVCDHGAAYLGERLLMLGRLCTRRRRRDAKGHWPTEYPPFSRALAGEAKSERVRVLQAANSHGRGEVLVLESDIDPSRWRNCIGPLQLLLSLFGIRTFRHKLASREEFEKLPRKASVIIGRANMSFAPQFMPDYEQAFAYKGEEIMSGRYSNADDIEEGSQAAKPPRASHAAVPPPMASANSNDSSGAGSSSPGTPRVRWSDAAPSDEAWEEAVVSLERAKSSSKSGELESPRTRCSVAL